MLNNKWVGFHSLEDDIMKLNAITFDLLIKYGREHNANMVNNMPWSFEFEGYPVSHENDRCYLITTPKETIRFTPKDIIILGKVAKTIIDTVSIGLRGKIYYL